jgi:hypothetical protein
MNTAARNMGYILKWGRRGTDYEAHFIVKEVAEQADDEEDEWAPPPINRLGNPIPGTVPRPIGKQRGRRPRMVITASR